MSQLKQKFDAGVFAITAEVTPPLSTDPTDMIEKVIPLKGCTDAVNVTDGASAKAHLDALVAALLLKQNGIEPILQMTGRDRNRIALQSEIVGAAALGITNLLMLTGDDPKAGDQPDAKPVFDLDSTGLVATAVSIRDRKTLPHGRPVKGEASFLLGVADAPIDPHEGWKPTSLLRKIEAGAQFAQTQFCMDLVILRRYLDHLKDAGVPASFRFLVGVAPLASAKSAQWIRTHLGGAIVPDWIIERLDRATDARAEGRAICVDLLHQLSSIEAVAGAHIMAPLNESTIPQVIAEYRR